MPKETEDKLRALLDRIALDASGSFATEYQKGVVFDVLERRLGPLLRAGQEMRDCKGLSDDQVLDRWDLVRNAVERKI